MKKTNDDNGMSRYDRYYRWQNQYYKTSKLPKDHQLLSAFVDAIAGKITVTLHVKGFRPMYEKNDTGLNNHFYLGEFGPIPVPVICGLSGVSPEQIQVIYSQGLREANSKEPSGNLRQEITDLLPFPNIEWFRDEGRIEDSRSIGISQKNTFPQNTVLWSLKHAELRELGEVFKLLVEKVYRYRLANEGYVPVEIFEACVGMGGVSVSVQIVNEVIENGVHIGFALRKRGGEEVGEKWQGLYHSTCATASLLTTPESAFKRNTIDAFGYLPTLDKLEKLGVTIHNEPERWSACVTIMYRRKVTREQVASFKGGWKIFTDIHDPLIIDHNQYLLEWVSDPDRKWFADVRNGWQP